METESAVRGASGVGVDTNVMGEAKLIVDLSVRN
jgi:hypothetical protein